MSVKDAQMKAMIQVGGEVFDVYCVRGRKSGYLFWKYAGATMPISPSKDTREAKLVLENQYGSSVLFCDEVVQKQMTRQKTLSEGDLLWQKF